MAVAAYLLVLVAHKVAPRAALDNTFRMDPLVDCLPHLIHKHVDIIQCPILGDVIVVFVVRALN